MSENNFEERAKKRRESIPFKAVFANGETQSQRGSVEEKIPSTPEEAGAAIEALWDLCSWLNPDFDKPMQKNVATVIWADGTKMEFT